MIFKLIFNAHSHIKSNKAQKLSRTGRKSFTKAFLTCAFSVLTVLSLTGCSYGLDELIHRQMGIETRADKLTTISADQVPSTTADEEYTVLIITDVHFGGSLERFDEEFIEEIKNLSPRPKFCVSLGDSVEHGIASEYERYNTELTDKLEALGIPVFNVVGNHDLFNTGWENYEVYNYPYTSFYTFKTSSFSWYFLDTASNTLGATQYLRLVEAFEDDSAPKIVFTHTPLYSNGTLYFVMQDSEERNKLISLCSKNSVQYYFVGHSHRNTTKQLGSFIERNLPSYVHTKSYGLLTVNEGTKTTDFELIFMDE